jgi:L-alanine-DL-glutamate epimerase-like enolase superfamily enzyme
VSLHVHANVHIQFAAALSNLHPAGLEYMPPDSGLDALEALLDEPLQVRDGRAVLPERPGLGLDWNWDAVARSAGE